MKNESKDYMRVSDTPKLVFDEKVYISAPVFRFNTMGFRKECCFAVTDEAVYEINKKSVKSRVVLEGIDAISKSTLSSEFVIHIKDDYDIRFISQEYRDIIIETLLEVLCSVRKLYKAFPVYVVPAVGLSQYTTSPRLFKGRCEVRPPADNLVLMNPEKYKDKEENSTATENLETEILFNQSKPLSKEITINDFELLRVIGQGSFGKVFLAKLKDTGKIYAMKVLYKKNIIEMDQLEHTKTEKLILQHINHPFIVSLEFAFQTPDKLYFVMEFMKGGDLFTYISKVKKVSESDAKFYAASAAVALGHLHKSNFIYRDLKPENILLDERGYAKLADFGLAKLLKNDEQAHTMCGTPEYVAPEVLLGKGHSRPADWWALGILIYEMVLGKTPFKGKNVQSLYREIIKKDLDFGDKGTISFSCKDIITKLLKKSPLNRLGSKGGLDEVLSHPWFAEINIPEMLKHKIMPPYKPLIKDSDWEKNFEHTAKLKVRESNHTADADVLRGFQKEFENLNFNKNSQP